MAKTQKKNKTVKKRTKTVAQKKSTTRKTKNTKPFSESNADMIAATPVVELQADAVGIRKSTPPIEDFADVSQERASIISIVRGLEEQVETAFKLKEVLEVELDTTQNKLSEALDARAQLEAQVESLGAQADLTEQLREDISFAEEERNKFANTLAETQPQLEEMTAERDSLTEQAASTETHIKDLESEKMALEARVMNLKDKITDADRLRKEFAEITEAHQLLREKSHNLTRQLEASQTAKDALEKELDGTHQNARTLQAEVEKLRDKMGNTDNRTTDMRIQLEDQQASNRELMEANTRLEGELKMLNVNYEAAKNELDAFKNALRDIRSEATQTSGRVRQRYFKPAPAKTRVTAM